MFTQAANEKGKIIKNKLTKITLNVRGSLSISQQKICTVKLNGQQGATTELFTLHRTLLLGEKKNNEVNELFIS